MTWDSLERDLAGLAAAPPDARLDGLEAAVWRKVAAASRERRTAMLTSGVQAVGLAASLAVSVMVGAALVEAHSFRAGTLRADLSASALAPSTLLDAER